MVSLIEMLDARERRVWHQKELLEQFHMPIISFTMNIAGPIKNNSEIKRGFDLGNLWLKQELDFVGMECIHFEEISPKTGNEAFYVVNSDPLELKRVTAAIEEECALGRLFDLDVIKVNGEKVEREELGLGTRRCLICGKPAKECARSRTHSVEELQKKNMHIIRDALETEDTKAAASLACRALLYEVGTSPKPGLVDRFNNGSHKDMDIFTFMNSSSALWPYFEACVRIGQRTADQLPAETFSLLRKEGQKAERTMFSATKGVNTHKGAIFSMGIVCGALGRLPRATWSQTEIILDECSAMTKGLVEKDFSSISANTAFTNGQKLYVNHGITGIRGQVEAGFPAVRNAGLPVLLAGVAEGKSLNDAGCAALLALMTTATDTNLIARSNMETYTEVMELVKDVLKQNPYPDQETLEWLDSFFIEKNLSPGGSADLLAICYLLYFLKEEATTCPSM
ncbi:MAG: triphosphoribosyl-dephospho-CoA synthase CitG [Lachnospiraceae bacterium]|nr:triphosphoribosyl-dephospho-CoA synthase CitG [Lachnospiraceae bacterium]